MRFERVHDEKEGDFLLCPLKCRLVFALRRPRVRSFKCSGEKLAEICQADEGEVARELKGLIKKSLVGHRGSSSRPMLFLMVKGKAGAGPVPERVDDPLPVLAEQLDRPVERPRVERSDLVMFQDLRPVHPFAGLQYAEVVAQLVGQHAADQGIDIDALGLQLADRLVQLQALVPIIDHQHRADGKRFIVVRRNLSHPQPGLSLHNYSRAEGTHSFS